MGGRFDVAVGNPPFGPRGEGMYYTPGAVLEKIEGGSEMTEEQMTPLAQYLVKLCAERNLSWRAASMRAGLSPEAISLIVRRGHKARPESLRKFAEGVGGDYLRMMELAGHLKPKEARESLVPEAGMCLGWLRLDRAGDWEAGQVACLDCGQTCDAGIWVAVMTSDGWLGPYCDVCASSV
jgi:hypothetical protein